MESEVTRFELPPTYGGDPIEKMTGTDANIRIRGLVVHSVSDELWTYEVPDVQGTPMRVVARTQLRQGFSGPRVVREVYVQEDTGPVHQLDWLTHAGYEPPKPSTQPVQGGDRVTAMPDGYSLGAGLVTSIEWKLHPMQAHYQLPPLWHWGWRVTVWFGGDQTREGAWKDHWVLKASDSYEGTRKNFESMWQRLEVEFKGRQAAE
ncbi:hypothetical protein ACFQ61_08115 [Streptomyces sp. NPDC056500]|uniref:hypothetical protein n=1 Tax=Streptomyces sp. NPDC056500 TaxID=3345840 RepID=UPI00367CB3FF